MNPNVQVPPPVHQTSGDPDVYPPAYPSGGSFHSYEEAISFVEMYSPKTTITDSKQLPSIPTLLHVWNLFIINPFCFLVQARCTHTILISLTEDQTRRGPTTDPGDNSDGNFSNDRNRPIDTGNTDCRWTSGDGFWIPLCLPDDIDHCTLTRRYCIRISIRQGRTH